jgi:hypothetical protein
MSISCGDLAGLKIKIVQQVMIRNLNFENHLVYYYISCTDRNKKKYHENKN